MKKSSFVTMIMGVIGGILFAIGMCMALILEWNLFKPGIIVGAIGALELMVTLIVWRKMTNQEPIRFNGKTILTIILAIGGALLLGLGMCQIMLWGKMILGMIIGIVGILLLISLIPMIKGIK